MELEAAATTIQAELSRWREAAFEGNTRGQRPDGRTLAGYILRISAIGLGDQAGLRDTQDEQVRIPNWGGIQP